MTMTGRNIVAPIKRFDHLSFWGMLSEFLQKPVRDSHLATMSPRALEV